MILNPEQVEPDEECNINTLEGKKAWNELQAQLMREASVNTLNEICLISL